ncbi:hypothetical protein [Rhodoblastus sp.]|uniref:hypothetical protein n=1 Tax=Rhodoblastus sp. TaxID=1962975 RepID=UPI0035B41730
MSRKTVQINVPAAPATKAVIPAKKAEAGAESWIAQASEPLGGVAEALGEAAFSRPVTPGGGVTFTVKLSAEPNPLEAAKVFFLLPQAALWFWTFGLAQRSMRGFPTWPPR